MSPITMTIQLVARLASQTRKQMGKPLQPMVHVQEGGQMKLAALTGYGPEELGQGLQAVAQTYPMAHDFFLILEDEGVIQVWELDRSELVSWPGGGYSGLELLAVGGGP